MPLEALEVLPVEGSPLQVFRIVSSDDRSSDEFLRSLMSSHALGLPPRTRTPEERFNLIHRGISCFRTHRQAERQALRWGLGEFVARIHLVPDEGICFAEWGSRGHMTIWSDPVKLREMTADIVRIRQGT